MIEILCFEYFYTYAVYVCEIITQTGRIISIYSDIIHNKHSENDTKRITNEKVCWDIFLYYSINIRSLGQIIRVGYYSHYMVDMHTIECTQKITKNEARMTEIRCIYYFYMYIIYRCAVV